MENMDCSENHPEFEEDFPVRFPAVSVECTHPYHKSLRSWKIIVAYPMNEMYLT